MNRTQKYYINEFIKSINYRVFTRNKVNIGLKMNVIVLKNEMGLKA
jgi:hypothetical protein